MLTLESSQICTVTFFLITSTLGVPHSLLLNCLPSENIDVCTEKALQSVGVVPSLWTVLFLHF